MRDLLSQALLTYKKKTIDTEAFITLFAEHSLSYEQIAEMILSFEEEGILEMVKAQGRNRRTPSLAYTYRIQLNRLKQELHEEIIRFRLHLHPSIHLDPYFSLHPSQWKEDLPFLQHIHQYLTTYGFPHSEVPAPERSVELVGNEKWMTEHHGKELLERVGLWEKMKIIPVSDPLMFAVNPFVLLEQEQRHLIVENKTTYQALLPVLTDTDFSTLIYGSGNKIIKSIEQFDRQLPIPQKNHQFYYFGDIDWSGMFIWHELNQKRPATLYMPFYQACLEHKSLAGKTNQRQDQEAISAFLLHFSIADQVTIRAVLEKGHYYPQEVLKTETLQSIWRQHNGKK